MSGRIARVSYYYCYYFGFTKCGKREQVHLRFKSRIIQTLKCYINLIKLIKLDFMIIY